MCGTGQACGGEMKEGRGGGGESRGYGHEMAESAY